MAGRKSNVLNSRHETTQKPKQKKKASYGLNALAIAEDQFPTKVKFRAHRYGEVEDFPKRKRDDDDDEEEEEDTKRRRTHEDDGSNADYGSDSEGNEWKVGQVDSEDDSDIDSDEALGSSDEERFEDFTFRGSSSKLNSNSKRKPTSTKRKEDDLSEGSDADSASDEDEFDDDLGGDAVDLATAWDMNAEEDDSDDQVSAKSSKKKIPVSTTTDDSEFDSDIDASIVEENSDGSDLSLSDDETDDKGDGLSKLQDFVSSLKTNSAETTSRKQTRGQENGLPTEYGLTSSRKLTVSDLLSSVTDSRLKGSLKHMDSGQGAKGVSSGSQGKLSAPLPKRQQDRIDRVAAYEKSKETLNRWINTVKANREAEHVSFPLPDPQEQQFTRLGPVEPKTDLESTIKAILVESGLATDEKSAEKQFQAAEELESRKMSLEEVRARNAELRKRRDLLFREEIRAKRIKKIKSKSYRRVHRKEREKLDEVERQALIDAGIDPDEQDRELHDRRRAEARMGAKHKDSKWAKSLKETGRATWDEDARSNMIDMAQRDEELQRRIEGRNVKSADDNYLESSSSGSEDQNDVWDEEHSDVEAQMLNQKLDALGDSGNSELSGPHSKLLSMGFMQKAQASRRQQNDEEIRKLRNEINGQEDESEEEEGGRRKFGKPKLATKQSTAGSLSKNEFEETISSEGEEHNDVAIEEGKHISSNHITNNSKSKTSTSAKAIKVKEAKPVVEEVTEEVENPWLVQNSRKNRKRQIDDGSQALHISVDNQEQPAVGNIKTSSIQKPRSSKTRQSKATIHNDQSGSDSDDENTPMLLQNHDLVKRAFAGDDVVADFEREKQETIEEEGDKVIDDTLPGWGSWTGAGIRKKQQKRQKKVVTKVEGIKPEQRKDARLGHVIINEKRAKKTVKYMATQLPHPFENRQQYERSLRQPIGPEWSTSDTFHESTKPRVLIKQGIIKPMQRPSI